MSVLSCAEECHVLRWYTRRWGIKTLATFECFRKHRLKADLKTLRVQCRKNYIGDLVQSCRLFWRFDFLFFSNEKLRRRKNLSGEEIALRWAQERRLKIQRKDIAGECKVTGIKKNKQTWKTCLSYEDFNVREVTREQRVTIFGWKECYILSL